MPHWAITIVASVISALLGVLVTGLYFHVKVIGRLAAVESETGSNKTGLSDLERYVDRQMIAMQERVDQRLTEFQKQTDQRIFHVAQLMEKMSELTLAVVSSAEKLVARLDSRERHG